MGGGKTLTRLANLARSLVSITIKSATSHSTGSEVTEGSSEIEEEQPEGGKDKSHYDILDYE